MFKQYKYLSILTLLLIVGCTFAGDPESYGSKDGFLMGLWHGTVFIWSLILCVFTDINIMSSIHTGWPYYVGFGIGLIALSWKPGLVFGLISLLLYFF